MSHEIYENAFITLLIIFIILILILVERTIIRKDNDKNETERWINQSEMIDPLEEEKEKSNEHNNEDDKEEHY